MSTAYLEWSLNVDCPACESYVDLVDQDDENDLARLIFSNKWDDVAGFAAFCPHCGHEFTISGVEY